RSKIRAKDFFPHRIVIEVELADVRGYGFIAGTHLLKPRPIVKAERFTQRESRQSGTITLLVLPLIADSIELGFRDRREPASEAVAILIGAQLFNIRNAVVVRIDQITGRG